MNSIERAPEPTMEEILSSIRRIVSDDGSNSVNQPTPSIGQQTVEGAASGEDEEADKRIIDDIARRLGGGEASSGDDDILDLTPRLDQTPHEPPVEAPSPVEAEETVELVTEVVTVEVSEPAAAANAAQSEPESADAQPASAIEQAIAALKVGDVPVAPRSPEPEPVAEPDSAPQPEPIPEPEPEVAAEPDLVLTEADTVTTEKDPVAPVALTEVPKPAPEPEPAPAVQAVPEPPPPAPEKPAFWSSTWPTKSEESKAEPAQSGQVNGERASNALQSSLEASVKGVLRPVLHKWLDDNMTRVLSAALHDELKGTDENMARLLTAALYDELADVEAFRQKDGGEAGGGWSH